MMDVKCCFSPITVYLDSEKSLTKGENTLGKGFLSLVMNLTKRISCTAFHQHRDQSLSEGDGRRNLASCHQAMHPHLCHTVLRPSRHWDCAGRREGHGLISWLLEKPILCLKPQSQFLSSDLLENVLKSCCISHTPPNSR